MQKLKIFIVIYALVLGVSFENFSFGQDFKKERRVYALDITASMWGFGKNNPEIFEKVKSNILESLGQISNPSTEIVFFAFGSDVATTIEVKANKEGVKEIGKYLNSLACIGCKEGDLTKADKVQRYTNIDKALLMLLNSIDPDKYNYLFLLTDGVHTASPKSNACAIISDICSRSNQVELHPYYVALTDKGFKAEIKECLKNTCFQVDTGCTFFTQVKPLRKNTSINIKESNLDAPIQFVKNSSESLESNVFFQVELIEVNDFFELEKDLIEVDKTLKETTIKFKVKAGLSLDSLKTELPQESEMLVRISLDEERNSSKIKLDDTSILVRVINKKEKTITITVLE